MEKEQNQKPEANIPENEVEKIDTSQSDNKNSENKTENTEVKSDVKDLENEKTPEEIILDLEDKLTRTFAEMENQRRRFEKEKEDAFEYGGFAFAKEALSLLDNLDRSKKILEEDETLKNSEALKKTLEHLDIINKDIREFKILNDK